MKKVLNNEELAVFSEQLAMILHSGISVLEGISILSEDAPTEEGKEILKSVYSHLEETGDFAEALRAPGVYPAYFTHMTEIGERSGTLEEVMASLSRHYEREEAISQSIREALTYPLIMLGMLTAVLVILMVQVMPVFRQVFEQLGLELSGVANTVFVIGQTIQRYSIFLLILFCVLVLIGFAAVHTDKGRTLVLTAAGHISWIRHISETLACSRFSSALSIALHSGLDIDEGFRLSSELVDQEDFKEKISLVRKELDEGEDLAEALKKSGIYSGLNARMISIGFRTGSSEAAFEKIAASCQQEADTRIQNLVAALEPTLVAVLSVLTGLILLSVMLPLLGIMSSIG